MSQVTVSSTSSSGVGVHSAINSTNALCELFLGCEAHFELWKRLFCLVPHTQKGSLYQVGGAEIWRIAETGYLSGTPKKR